MIRIDLENHSKKNRDQKIEKLPHKKCKRKNFQIRVKLYSRRQAILFSQ